MHTNWFSNAISSIVRCVHAISNTPHHSAHKLNTNMLFVWYFLFIDSDVASMKCLEWSSQRIILVIFAWTWWKFVVNVNHKLHMSKRNKLLPRLASCMTKRLFCFGDYKYCVHVHTGYVFGFGFLYHFIYYHMLTQSAHAVYTPFSLAPLYALNVLYSIYLCIGKSTPISIHVRIRWILWLVQFHSQLIFSILRQFNLSDMCWWWTIDTAVTTTAEKQPQQLIFSLVAQWFIWLSTMCTIIIMGICFNEYIQAHTHTHT